MKQIQLTGIHNLKSHSLLFLIIVALAIIAAYQPMYILVGVICIATIWLIINRPYWIVYLFVASFPFLSLIPRGTYLPILKLDEFLIIIGYLAWVLSPKKKTKPQLTQIDILFWGLIIAGSLLPFIGHLLRGWETEWLETIALLKGYLIYRLILLTVTNRKHQERIIILLLLPFSIVLIIAILQMLNMGNIRSLLAEIYGGSAAYVLISDTSARYFRATSTLGNWNALGSYAALGALLAIALIVHKSRKVNFFLLITSLAACIGLLILAGSSSSIVGFLIGVAVLWLHNSKKIKLSKIVISLLPVAVVALVVFFLVGRQVLQNQLERQTASQPIYFWPSGKFVSTYGLPSSFMFRVYLADYLFNVMRTDRVALLMGFGEGQNARALLSWTTAESGYMSMLFYNGPLYLLIYLMLLEQIYLYARYIRRKLPPDFNIGGALTSAAVSVVAAMTVMNIISSYYTAAGTSHFFWILIACTTASIRLINVSNAVIPANPSVVFDH